MLVEASPLPSNSSVVDLRSGWIATSGGDRTIVERGPLDKVLDRAYSKSNKKGEKRWADAISPSTKQRIGNFLRWDALVIDAADENTKPGPSGKQPVAKNSGWRAKPVESQAEMDDVTRDYTVALNGVKLTTENSRNVVMVHEKTDARYKGLYSPENGLLIAYERHGPKYQTDTHSHLEASDVPDITQWSDVAFLTWIHTISELGLTAAEAPLKQIFIGPITNTESIDIIKKAIQEAGHKGQELSSFEKAVESKKPGAIVQKADRHFMAVVGTDNLAGVGHLLSQHRTDLGKKIIGSLGVFGKGANLYVKIEVVDQK